MFRDGVVLVDPFSAPILLHEQIVPARVDALVREWSQSAVQETPITVLVDGALPPGLIVADGHHRYAAARQLAALRGARLAMAARFFDEGATILPAHRVIRRMPVWWKVPLSPGDGPLALHTRDGRVQKYDCTGLSAVDQLRRLVCLECEWTLEGDETKALAELSAGRAEAVLLVPALTMDDVLSAARSGQLLPPRSTNFQPKPPESSIRFELTDASSNVAISS
jgi:hypothetical protein